jgi:hydroxymethylglutaryl-CoA lyase
MSSRLQVCDVGPRDGLQNQPHLVSAEDKQRLIALLYDAGVRMMEATSFVSPTAVPQMADADQVMPSTARFTDLRAMALLMNERGYERARAAGTRAVSIVVVCSETLALKNNRRPSRETVETARRIVELAKRDGAYTRVCLAAAWHCPYDGKVDRGRVLDYAAEVWDMGIDELSVADTIGHAQPFEVRDLAKTLVDRYGSEKVSVHLHDTQGMGLANAFAALDAGVRTLDASVGGLGGCPFAKGAAGNLATEDLVLLADKSGLSTGIDLDKLWGVVEAAEQMVQRPTGGRSKGYWLAERAKHASTERAAVCV